VDTIAVDGTKVGSDAALNANHGGEWIREQIAAILAEAREADAAEDAQPGVFDLDVLPVELLTASGRLRRLEVALPHRGPRRRRGRRGRAARRRRPRRSRRGPQAARPHTQRPPRCPGPPRSRRAGRVHPSAQRGANGRCYPEALSAGDLDRAVAADSEVQRTATATARDAAAAATPASKANTTDPDSRSMNTPGGWVQGFNAQAAVNDQQIILAAEVSQDANDVGLYQPMVAAARAMLDDAGVDDAIGTALADAGYWSHDNATGDGPDRLIVTLKDHKQRRAARDLGTTSGEPPEDATALEAMEHQLRTEDGAAAYAKRSHIVEPVFAVEANHGYHRFRRRGLQAAASEWALMSTAHNLGKLHRVN
jgi:hypothetical protein